MASSIDTQYTVKEAAELLKVQPLTIRRWISNGYLRAYRYGPGRVVRIAERDILKLRCPVTSLSSEGAGEQR